MLEKQGLVERKQGKGTFVASDVDESPSRGDFSELVRRLRQLDARSTLKDVDIATVAADEATARDLDLPVGAPVVQASFVRMRDKEPIGYTRSEEHTSDLQSLMRISYAVFCLTKKRQNAQHFSV